MSFIVLFRKNELGILGSEVCAKALLEQIMKRTTRVVLKARISCSLLVKDTQGIHNSLDIRFLYCLINPYFEYPTLLNMRYSNMNPLRRPISSLTILVLMMLFPLAGASSEARKDVDYYLEKALARAYW